MASVRVPQLRGGPAVFRGPNPSYLLLPIVLIGGISGYLYATGETVGVMVREERVERGESRHGLPVDVHVLLTDRGPLPIFGLPVVGYLHVPEVYAAIRTGRRYRVRLARWPWSGDRMVIEIYPQALAH